MLYQKSQAKDIVADQEQLTKIVSNTIDKMAQVVGRTLGPGGKPVLIERDGLSPLITKDGVTVAKSLGVGQAADNIIVDSAKEICLNTAKDAGDGTTSAIVLANALVHHGLKFMRDNPKYNPQRFITELQETYDTVIVPFLTKRAIKVTSDQQLEDVATISANGDKLIAKVVVEAILAAGDDGTILLEEGQGDVTRVETVDGYVIPVGLKELGQIGPAFINDKANQQAKLDKGIVFLYDGSMNDLKVTGLIQGAIESSEIYGSPMIIMAHDFSDLVLDMFAKNVKGGVTIVPIKTPMSGLPNSRSLFLQDMAAYTGATVHDPGNIEDVDEECFGYVESAKCNMYETFLIADFDPAAVEDRVIQLRAIKEAALSEMDRMHVDAAISKLTGGVVTVWIGGASELEVREKKTRTEDAVEAVRAAITEGIIPGGCSVNLVLADMIKNHRKVKQSWSVMVKALCAPFDLLLTNCGEEPEHIASMMSRYTAGKRTLPKRVFDAAAHKIVSPYKAGIIEPAKVCRVSIGNALSVAGLLITLGGIVCVPRSAELETQLALTKQSFKDMMETAGQ